MNVLARSITSTILLQIPDTRQGPFPSAENPKGVLSHDAFSLLKSGRLHNGQRVSPAKAPKSFKPGK